MNDIDLWEDVRHGAQNAVGELFNRYTDVMLAYGLKFNPDREMIKDAIQNVFLQILNSQKRLGATDNVKAYLLLSLRRALARQASSVKTVPLGSEELTFKVDLYYCSFINDTSLDETTVNRRKKLIMALNALPSRQKEAVYLHYIQEMPLNKVSEIMDVNYQSTRNLIHRALLGLRESFGLSSRLSISSLAALMIQLF
jgi:RNA polymerase sigma-70 factor (ECF subfamily)